MKTKGRRQTEAFVDRSKTPTVFGNKYAPTVPERSVTLKSGEKSKKGMDKIAATSGPLASLAKDMAFAPGKTEKRQKAVNTFTQNFRKAQGPIGGESRQRVVERLGGPAPQKNPSSKFRKPLDPKTTPKMPRQPTKKK